MVLLKTLMFIGILITLSLAESSIICGYVVDQENGREIVNAKIILKNTPFSKKTDADGYFEFSNIPAATYKIVVTHYKYKQTVLEELDVSSAERITLTIKMKRKKKQQENNTILFSTSRKNSTRKAPGSPKDKPTLKASSPEPEAGTISVEREIVKKVELPPDKSGLLAGYADDNRQFNYFIKFLEQNNEIPHYPLLITERIQVHIKDKNGKPIPNAKIKITEYGKIKATGRSYADGSFYIYPREISVQSDKFQITVEILGHTQTLMLNRFGPRNVTVTLPLERPSFEAIPLDLLFILDTSGSMGEEIERLKNTIQIINLNLNALNIKPALRFGMVVYRDRDDDYVTQTIPFTSDLDDFRGQLKNVSADGGGDTPEDLQAALDDALHKMDWNPDGLRLAFIITDAGLHMDYGQEFTYADAVREAKEKAIKIFSVGTGGLDISGEYVLRQISQYTSAKYIFLTYGEKGESEGGRPGSVSHHTGTNFNTEKLEAIIIRFAKEELAHLSNISIEETLPWFEAVKVDDEHKQQTLQKLFTRAISELIDFSTISITKDTPVAALPFQVHFESQAANAEYFYEQLMLSLSQNSTFKMIERNDLQHICKEIGLQLSGLAEDNNAVKVGTFIGAEMLIIGQFYFNEGKYELFLKLVRVQTAEILSVTRVRIDTRLGL